jgi:hypothetical protein
MKKKIAPLADFKKAIEIRFLMLRADEPIKENIKWVIGLTDNETSPVKAKHLKVDDIEKAKIAFNFIMDTYDGVEKGKNFGVEKNRTIVYLTPTPI